MTDRPMFDGYTEHRPNQNLGDVTLLPGWPGYRNRPGRSGLDYIDNQIEVAHMTGVYIRKILSGAWLRADSGQSPMITLIATLIFLKLVPDFVACPVILIVIFIGVIAAIRHRGRSSINETAEAERRDGEGEDETE